MRKIEKYIQKEIGLSFLFTLCVLIVILWIVQSLKFIGIFLRSAEGIFSFLKLIILSLPDTLTIITPISLFIAVITVFNRLMVEKEMTSLFSLGYSFWDVTKPLLKLAALFSTIVYFVSLFILPASFKEMRNMEARLKTSFPSVLAQEGVFTSFQDITLYVNKKQNRRLEGILAYIHKDKENPYTISAKTGEIIVQNGIPKIFMAQGTRQEKDVNTNEISILYFDKTIISLVEESPKSLNRRPRKSYERGILELLSFENFYKDGGLVLLAEGFQRLLTPLYSIAFSCIAAFFLLMSRFNREGNFAPMTKAVFTAILIQGASIAFLNMGAKNGFAILLAYLLVIGTIFSFILYTKKISGHEN